MASFLSSILSIFTGGAKPAAEAAGGGSSVAEPQLYGECTIHATPQREGNQFRLAGRIEKQVNGETLVRNFIRADVFTSLDDAVETHVSQSPSDHRPAWTVALQRRREGSPGLRRGFGRRSKFVCERIFRLPSVHSQVFLHILRKLQRHASPETHDGRCSALKCRIILPLNRI